MFWSLYDLQETLALLSFLAKTKTGMPNSGNCTARILSFQTDINIFYLLTWDLLYILFLGDRGSSNASHAPRE